MDTNAVQDNSILKRLDDISNLIKTVEIQMKSSGYVIPVSFGKLAWVRHTSGKMRIMSGEKPLIECKAEHRIECVKFLKGLEELARRRTLQALDRTEEVLK